MLLLLTPLEFPVRAVIDDFQEVLELIMLGFGTHRIVILCVSHPSFYRLLRYLPIFLNFKDLRRKMGTVELFGLSSI